MYLFLQGVEPRFHSLRATSPVAPFVRNSSPNTRLSNSFVDVRYFNSGGCSGTGPTYSDDKSRRCGGHFDGGILSGSTGVIS